MLLWWEGLTAVDQANISSIEKLVTQAEGIFQSERESLAVSYDILGNLQTSKTSEASKVQDELGPTWSEDGDIDETEGDGTWSGM